MHSILRLPFRKLQVWEKTREGQRNRGRGLKSREIKICFFKKDVHHLCLPDAYPTQKVAAFWCIRFRKSKFQNMHASVLLSMGTCVYLIICATRLAHHQSFYLSAKSLNFSSKNSTFLTNNMWEAEVMLAPMHNFCMWWDKSARTEKACLHSVWLELRSMPVTCPQDTVD